jgi:hypothetical protein
MTTGREQAVVLEDWPQPAAGAPEPRLFADDTSVAMMYRLADDRYAVIRFPLCTYVGFGAPNDEALAGHRLYASGLRHYSVHEVIHSSLIADLERRNSVHPRHDRESYLKGHKHYIFTFQDRTLECVVASEKWWAPLIEVFGSRESADSSWRTPIEK